MKHTIVATALVLAAGFAALPAFAAAPDAAASAAPSSRASMMFWFLDRNNDGFIDATEITAFRTAKFASLDTNGDGVLSKDEAIASIGKGRMHGKNGEHGQGGKKDGQPSEARMEKRQDRALARMGFTGDKTSVTLAEFTALDTPMVQRADTDKDGKVSKAEFLAAAASMKHPKMPD